jgi:DNA-binding CsgD family transcriptional regulator
MEPLRQHDFRAMLQFLESIYAATDIDAMMSGVARELSTIVPCEIASYAEINKRRLRINWVWHGAEQFPDAQEIFIAHRHENPVVVHNARTLNSPPVKTTDFISLREFRRRGVYKEFYRRLGPEYMMAAKVPSDPQVQVAVAVLRSGRDFSERERRILTVMQPQLLQAYRNATLTSDLGDQLALLGRGIEIGGLGVVAIGVDGRVRWMTDTARDWLAAYFPSMPGRNRPPEEVAAWLRHSESPAVSAETMPEAPMPLIVARKGRRLVLRRLRHAGQILVLLREGRTTIEAADLSVLGLAPRQAEVLAWAALGKTNIEIATILAISPRTVGHTLQQVYRKLGVESRAAAATQALRTLGANLGV